MRRKADHRRLEHRLWPMYITKTTSSTTSNFKQGLHASDLFCAHLQSDIRQCHALSLKTLVHNMWLVYIDWAILNSAKGCQHEQPLLVYGQMMSITTGLIIQGMHASYMTSRHVETDIVQWNAASTKTCTHRLWHVFIISATFSLSSIRNREQRHVKWANSKKHHLRSAHLSRVVYTLSRVH